MSCVGRLSVRNACIVAKRYVVGGRRWFPMGDGDNFVITLSNVDQFSPLERELNLQQPLCNIFPLTLPPVPHSLRKIKRLIIYAMRAAAGVYDEAVQSVSVMRSQVLCSEHYPIRTAST